MLIEDFEKFLINKGVLKEFVKKMKLQGNFATLEQLVYSVPDRNFVMAAFFWDDPKWPDISYAWGQLCKVNAQSY